MKMVADWALTRLRSRVTKLEGQLAAGELVIMDLETKLRLATADVDGLTKAVEALQWKAAQDAISIGWFLSFMNDVDSITSFVGNRYCSRVPANVVEELLRVSGIARRAIKSRGRGETADAAGPNPAGETHAGSTPVAPTGAVRMSDCPLCGSARSVQGNVASCISCGGDPW